MIFGLGGMRSPFKHLIHLCPAKLRNSGAEASERNFILEGPSQSKPHNLRYGGHGDWLENYGNPL